MSEGEPVIEGYTVAATGPFFVVCISKKVKKVIENAPPSDRRKVGRLMGHLAEHGQALLSADNLKREGAFPSGLPGVSNQVVWVFRSNQLRVYGGFCRVNNREIFVCDEADIKKQDAADQRLLARAGKHLGERNANQ
ncbi:MAG: hypothetical protein V4586_01670 [Pseudomonadota bacterium]